MRGPVARLLGLVDLSASEEDPAQARQWVELIGKTSTDLDLIIKDPNEVLDLRNEPRKYLESVYFDDVWRQSLNLLQESLNGDEEIMADFTEAPVVTTVPAMLQSIVYNLLSNAIKFRSSERPLRVVARSWRSGRKLFLSLTDNGLRFDTHLHEEKLCKLYKRFYSHVDGRGLGLYLFKSQVEMMHGTVTVDSQPGQGSVFTIALNSEAPIRSEAVSAT